MIYANYAATTPRLSEAVLEEIYAYLGGAQLNFGRNFGSLDKVAIALRARKAIANLLGANDPLRVIFTSGATAALNMAIRGFLRPGDHVLATSIEHNATARPLHVLEKAGFIELQWLQCDPDGSLAPEKFSAAIRKNTRLFVMPHASNVLGTILPVNECFKIAHEHNVITVLDTAQTSGVLPWKITAHCDFVAFAGHKGLGAFSGTGGFIIGERACGELKGWVSGGTGSDSHSLDMPDYLPDKYEAGTQNTPGILSLAASVEEIIRTGVENIWAHECACLKRFLEGLSGIKKVKPYGTLNPDRSVAAVSLTVDGYDAGEVSQCLYEQHGIVTRSGLHCSPLAHKTAGTYPGGTVRFSFGRLTTEAEIDVILQALSSL